MTGIKIRERGKWLAALALCLSCFLLCAALTAVPTRAEEAPKTHDAVAGYKNVYERLDAAEKSKSPKEFFYASGTALDKVYNAALKEDAGKFSIGIGGYETAPTLRYFSVKANGTLNTKVDPLPATPPAATDPKLIAIAGRVNLYEVCDAGGTPLVPKLFIYANSAVAQEEELLPALKVADKGGDASKDKYYLQLAGDTYIAVAKDGTLDCNDVIKKLGTANEEVLFPLPPPVYKYKAVEGYKNLYEMLDKDGKSKSPKEYIYSTKAPEDGKEPPAGAQEALVKGDAFYVCFLENSGIFLAVNADGTLNFSDVIWWGADKTFGTKDDLATTMKEENGYYYWQQAQGVWQMILGIFNPLYTTTAPASTSSTAAPVYKYKAVTGYKNLYELLGADGNSKNPREFLYGLTAPTDGSAPPASSHPAYAKGDNYYVPLLEHGGIFLAVETDGSLSFDDAIWWGPDKKFGTADDLDTSVKLEAGQYFWKTAEGLWQLITNALLPDPTTTANSLLTTQETLPPKTGTQSFNAGAAAAMALLLMGCVYCGCQAFRRRARAF
ncbi:MAG: hypothetical protein FWE98_05740 [Oscillospiraceae bacterium]|nr:hypothetical protein [Oscillospiraceae bacterium]